MEPTEHPEMAYVPCGSCGRLSRTGIQVTPESFETSEFIDNTAQCNTCGENISWSKKDMVLLGDILRDGKKTPVKLISVALVICERFMVEQDSVMSAVRLVDQYHITIPPSTPLENLPPVPISAIGMIKAETPASNERHLLQFFVQRPDGQVQELAEATAISVAHNDDQYYAINAPLQMMVVPRLMGLHYLIWKLDGEEIARAIFMFKPRPERQSNRR